MALRPPPFLLHRVAWAEAWIKPMWRGISRARTLGLAAEMAFWVFLSLVPLAAVAGLAAAELALHKGWLAGGVLATVPPEARHMIDDQVAAVSVEGRRLAPVALGIFVWLAATGVHAVFDALEVQTGVSRAWWKKRLLAMVSCIGLSLGVAFLGLLATGLGWVERVVGRAIPLAPVEGTPAGGALRMLLGFLAAVGMIAALYWVGIPRESRARLPQLPGAVLAVLLIGVLGWGYTLSISKKGTGSAYLGSLAVIGVTMTTLWLFSVALLLGAELNKVIADRRAAASGGMVTVAKHLPTRRGIRWPLPRTPASSSPPISPRSPTRLSTGPFRWPNGSARGSR
jgi:membrane protein